MPFISNLPLVGMVFALAPLLGGCCTSKVEPFDIRVTREAAVQGREVKVHLVGIHENERDRFAEASGYWAASDLQQSVQGRRRELSFKINSPENEYVLTRDDPIWEASWNNQAWLVVMASNLKDIYGKTPEEKKQEMNQWIAIIPLDRCWWDSRPREVRVSLMEGEVGVTPQPRATKKE